MRRNLNTGCLRGLYRTVPSLLVFVLTIGCASSPMYQSYTRPTSPYTRIQFEYPDGWELLDRSRGGLVDITLCERSADGGSLPSEVHDNLVCLEVITVRTMPINATTPDIETVISRTLASKSSTPDYAAVRETAEVAGFEAQRVEVCYSAPESNVVPEGLTPTILHAVYFQAGRSIYEVEVLRPAERPCDPTGPNFSAFEHLLDTFVILEP